MLAPVIGICGWLTVLATLVLFARAGQMADAETFGGRRKVYWPLMSAGTWAFCFVVLGRGFYVGLLLQIVLFFAIGYWRARANLRAEERQMERVRREVDEREERFRRERDGLARRGPRLAARAAAHRKGATR